MTLTIARNFLLAILAFSLGCTNSGKKTGEADATAPDSARFRGQTLNILCWEGYADEKFTKAF